jgi:O-antigen/teichoic acid export membrane protein
VGLFNKADSLSALPARTIGGSAYQTVFRALATVQENLDKSQYIYFRTVSLVAVYTLPFYVGLAWLAGPFIVGVYGPSWAAAATPLQILAVTGVFRCITNPSGAVIAAQNRLGAEFRIQLEVWLVLAIGVWQGLKWGIVGVAWGLLPSFLYGSIRMFFLARRCVGGGIPQLLKALTPALGLCSWLAAVLVLVDRLLPSGWDAERPLLYLLAMGGIGALAYTGAFLYAPIPALKGERERWRRRLHLP